MISNRLRVGCDPVVPRLWATADGALAHGIRGQPFPAEVILLAIQ
jgi:hypothetical protein